MTACSMDVKSPADKYKGQSAETIFNGGEQSLAKESYKDAVEKFEALDILYPFSNYEEQAQLDIIYAYYKSGDYPGASAAATRYTHLYPRSEHVDYAYYMKGIADYSQNRGLGSSMFHLDLSKRDIGSTKDAFNDFSELITRYPHSVYVPDARGRMIYLRNVMAQYELNVAEYYYDRHAYVAAANRANNVVQHYQEAPAVIPALGIMVQSYRALKLDEPANKALAVLAYNYPDSDVYKKLMGEKVKKK